MDRIEHLVIPHGVWVTLNSINLKVCNNTGENRILLIIGDAVCVCDPHLWKFKAAS